MPAPKFFEKLVRDHIPDIIRRKCQPVPPMRHIAPGSHEYRQRLLAKLVEEFEELLNAQTSDEFIQEAADLRTVIETAVRAIYARLPVDIIAVQQQRDLQRGRFEQGIVMSFPKDKQRKRLNVEVTTRGGSVATLEDL